MKLPALGVEYLDFTARADFELDGTLEVYVSTDSDYPGDVTWSAASWLAAETVDEDGTHVRAFTVLVAGSAVVTPGAATQAASGTNHVFVRLTDTPEIIIRPAGRFQAF
jgi:hypothetical protein